MPGRNHSNCFYFINVETFSISNGWETNSFQGQDTINKNNISIKIHQKLINSFLNSLAFYPKWSLQNYPSNEINPASADKYNVL